MITLIARALAALTLSFTLYALACALRRGEEC
jgi:hypothetical protein